MRDREQPRAEPGVVGEPLRVLREPQERLLKQVLRDIATPRHAHEITVEPAAVRGEHRVERTGLAPAQACDPIGLACSASNLGTTHHQSARDTQVFLSRSTQRRVLPRDARLLPRRRLDDVRGPRDRGAAAHHVGEVRAPASPQGLSIIRALTMTVVFASIAGVVTDLAAVAHNVPNNPELMKEPLANLLWGFNESMAPAILGFSLVTIAWILVAFGVRRMPLDR